MVCSCIFRWPRPCKSHLRAKHLSAPSSTTRPACYFENDKHKMAAFFLFLERSSPSPKIRRTAVSRWTILLYSLFQAIIPLHALLPGNPILRTDPNRNPLPRPLLVHISAGYLSIVIIQYAGADQASSKSYATSTQPPPFGDRQKPIWTPPTLHSGLDTREMERRK